MVSVETSTSELDQRIAALWQAWGKTEIPVFDNRDFVSAETLEKRASARKDAILHHMGLLNAFLPEVYEDVQTLIELEKNSARVYKDRLASPGSDINFGQQKAELDIEGYRIRDAYSSGDKKELGAVFLIGYEHQQDLNRTRMNSEGIAA